MSSEPVDKQSQKEHQEGSLLDHIKHHSWQQGADSGIDFKFFFCPDSILLNLIIFLTNTSILLFLQTVIEANIIGPLIHLLQNSEFDIKKEAAWAISNATSGGSHDQIKYLVSQGCIKPLCDLLICPDPRIVTVCLEGLENILKVGEAEKNLGRSGDVNLYAQMIDDAEGLEKIENLQSHDNNEIYEKAVKLLKTYWLEEEDDAMPPGETAGTQPGGGGGFHFGGGDVPVPSGGFNFN